MGPRKAYPLGSAPPIRLGSARECRSWWSARPDARAAPVPSGCRNQLLEDGSRTSGAKYGTWRAWRCRLDVRRPSQLAGWRTRERDGAAARRWPHGCRPAPQLAQHGTDLLPREHDREAMALLGMDDTVRRDGERPTQHRLVHEQQRGGGLVLRGRADPPTLGEMREKRLHLGRAHCRRMP